MFPRKTTKRMRSRASTVELLAACLRNRTSPEEAAQIADRVVSFFENRKLIFFDAAIDALRQHTGGTDPAALRGKKDVTSVSLRRRLLFCLVPSKLARNEKRALAEFEKFQAENSNQPVTWEQFQRELPYLRRIFSQRQIEQHPVLQALLAD